MVWRHVHFLQLQKLQIPYPLAGNKALVNRFPYREWENSFKELQTTGNIGVVVKGKRDKNKRKAGQDICLREGRKEGLASRAG